MNLRGTAIPVLNLGAWFGATQREMQLDDFLIVLRASTRTAALHVEHVRGVVAIAQSGNSTGAKFPAVRAAIRGRGGGRGDIIFLPDVAGFLAAAENLAQQKAAAA